MPKRSPIELYDGRGKIIPVSSYSRGRGNLIDPQRISETYKNKSISRLDRDHHQNVGVLSRLDLMSLGRYLYANFGPVRMALNQMVCFATDDFVPSYVGEDAAFKDAFSNWLPFHDLNPDVGSLATMQQLRRLLVISAFRDGDVGVVLTESPEGGRPKLQLIPAHRIGARQTHTDIVQEGRFEGARLIDGVIVDPATHRPLGYRVFTGDETLESAFVDIPVQSMRLFMSSMDFVGQLRGMSALGGAAFNFFDVMEWEKNELLAQRVSSAITLIKKDESGEMDPTSAALGIDQDPTNCEETEFYQEFKNGEIIHISPRESVDAFISNRPTSNQREFIQSAIRAALAYLGFSVDFAFDATKIGGASMRVVADQQKRRVEEIQTTLLEPCLKWYFGYAVAKATKNLLLPATADPFALRFMGRKQITADRRYDSQVDLAEYRAGLRTLDETASLRGQDWKRMRDQQERETVDLLERAKRLAESFDITIEAAIAMIDDRVKPSPVMFEEAPEPAAPTNFGNE